ncbi:SCO family protein [Pedobacter antarcticus]|uniref:Electron transporter n=2 Tax=Pedobacter antarcticus TaxID=34086 RepID=A0A081PGU6_9SPHI|nr:SCO family protein [Pedobacter antarcticus]KEQ29919.1 electron transporter [Pedobacter antarcticus 4BY]SDL98486.1 protein SCO1/2 [Pedobacter antarcticus]SFE79586.1 protein SCO1/2 [Pedobacter antarcticus]
MRLTSIKKVLILVSILAVPGFLYYALVKEGKNRYKPLPFFGPKEVASTFHSKMGKQIPDTIYHMLPDFKLLNQAADSVTWKSYEGKIIVLNLFYTQGDNYAVEFAGKAMKNYMNTYRKNPLVHAISLSIDPVADKPSELKKYADKIGANAGKWDLLSGDSTEIYQWINKGLYIDAHQGIENGEKKFIYSNLFVLLDPQHRIRGYYDATNQEALSKLDDEIKVLIAEELRNVRDGR